MTPAPSRSAIVAAEQRLLASGRETRDHAHRLQVAVRTTLARPSSLALIGGAAGILGFLVARRPHIGTAASKAGVTVAATATLAGLVRAYALRYGMHYGPLILRQIWQSQVARSKPVTPRV